MAIKRDYKAKPPENLTELNKDSMLAYVKSLGNKEDIKFFVELLDANRTPKTLYLETPNHSKGDEITGYNMTAIRKAFAKRYFPKLLEKKKYVKKGSFEDELEKLRKELD